MDDLLDVEPPAPAAEAQVALAGVGFEPIRSRVQRFTAAPEVRLREAPHAHAESRRPQAAVTHLQCIAPMRLTGRQVLPPLREPLLRKRAQQHRCSHGQHDHHQQRAEPG